MEEFQIIPEENHVLAIPLYRIGNLFKILVYSYLPTSVFITIVLILVK